MRPGTPVGTTTFSDDAKLVSVPLSQVPPTTSIHRPASRQGLSLSDHKPPLSLPACLWSWRDVAQANVEAGQTGTFALRAVQGTLGWCSQPFRVTG